MLVDVAYIVKVGNTPPDNRDLGDIVYACFQDQLVSMKALSPNHSIILVDNIVTRYEVNALRLGETFSEWHIDFDVLNLREHEILINHRRLHLSVSRLCEIVKNKINQRILSIGDLM